MLEIRPSNDIRVLFEVHIQLDDVCVWYLCRGDVGCGVLLHSLDQDMVHHPNVLSCHCVHERLHANNPGADIHVQRHLLQWPWQEKETHFHSVKFKQLALL